ncbi:MAG: dTMP kinase [Erysipelotrichaceae bacterium]|nr:dTMP kinase [Erysipelotrichaceae bacterium]
MNRGWFIVFEGCDGSGKTTVSKGVYQKLLDAGYPVIYTREPGGIDISEQIRRIILDPSNLAMDRRTEALLYAASRRQHLAEKVIPALKEHKIIICDRFLYSSLVYQGYARGIGIEEVYQINEFAIEGYMPDRTIFLDILPEVGLERIQNRTFKDRLDQESMDFHHRVYEGYQMINQRYSDSIEKFDANRKPEEIIEDVYSYITRLVQE